MKTLVTLVAIFTPWFFVWPWPAVFSHLDWFASCASYNFTIVFWYILYLIVVSIGFILALSQVVELRSYFWGIFCQWSWIVISALFGLLTCISIINECKLIEWIFMLLWVYCVADTYYLLCWSDKHDCATWVPWKFWCRKVKIRTPKTRIAVPLNAYLSQTMRKAVDMHICCLPSATNYFIIFHYCIPFMW